MFNQQRGKLRSVISPVVLLLLLSSAPVHAKTFFMQEEKPVESYYSNDAIRSEEISGGEQGSSQDYSRKHRLVTDYLNSDNDPVAADARWDSSQTIRVGVIRRSHGNLDYAYRVCKLIIASKLKPQGMTVRIIYLPSLIAFDRLETLMEYQCAK